MSLSGGRKRNFNQLIPAWPNSSNMTAELGNELATEQILLMLLFPCMPE